MNHVTIDINRIEFAITDACSSQCKHCSVTVVDVKKSKNINADAAIHMIKQITTRFSPDSIMTFGGEPLLYAETVCKIHSTARDCGIPDRSIITNGFFSKDEQKISAVATDICVSGVSGILISVDAFHQEYVPIEPVIHFAAALMKNNIPHLRVHPAWVINKDHANRYNEETHRLLKIFNAMGIETSNGNNIFPSDNALKHLSEYFDPPDNVNLDFRCGERAYTGRLDEVYCIFVNPMGEIKMCGFTLGNIYHEDISTILEKHNPHSDPIMHTLINGGVKALVQYAENHGKEVDTIDCYSACGVCRKIVRTFSQK